ncbi:Aspartate/alanine antiporter [bioreactor metagenome]|uniref:Aspartate/alanine antiporter n=1 Tax=bioreactor metagenome TaxID=1076179 RepID=A0A644UQY0_9ZZZZ|nr:putative transporter [Bacteroidales bacterium]MBP8678030.1 putative transporter [Bacteroidales bacterium]MBP9979109.1 putative transporter [Bacteroidales bacterium]
MEWISKLLFSEGIAQSVLVLSLVISVGIILSRIKIKGISLGITWILFSGIIFSNLGFLPSKDILHFVKEFGLILFVYSIGLQVGPGFFSSFKKGGLKLNMLAAAIVVTGVIVTIIIHIFSDIPLHTMAGIMSGAITNTPGLGAAQQTFFDLNGVSDPSIATGYAVAYPLGVVGIILSIIFLKSIFRIDSKGEYEKYISNEGDNPEETIKQSFKVANPQLFNLKINQLKKYSDKPFVISRYKTPDGSITIAGADTLLMSGGEVLVILRKSDKDAFSALFGGESLYNDDEWMTYDMNVIPRRVLVTKEAVHGKSLASLKLGKAFGIIVTRINRAGVDLVPRPDLRLQIGDRLTVVGSADSVEAAAKVIGNSQKRLREPNLAAIFIGIAAGILLGSIPFLIPGIPQPVKLGLAGGPLIVAILISKFGPKFKLVTFTTMSANLMLREIGISLFLACVGLEAGKGFVDTILNGNGWLWMVYGFAITVLPILIVGFIAKRFIKLNFFSVMGLIAGSTTDPPALAFSGKTAGNDIPAVTYATVYPLTMFLRVLFAQLLIMFS